MATATNPVFSAIKLNTEQAGCGTRFREARWFVIRNSDGKPMRDVGPANVKWAAEVEQQACALAAAMNARAAE